MTSSSTEVADSICWGVVSNLRLRQFLTIPIAVVFDLSRRHGLTYSLVEKKKNGEVSLNAWTVDTAPSATSASLLSCIVRQILQTSCWEESRCSVCDLKVTFDGLLRSLGLGEKLHQVTTSTHHDNLISDKILLRLLNIFLLFQMLRIYQGFFRVSVLSLPTVCARWRESSRKIDTAIH